jgi:hypothetical protein
LSMENMIAKNARRREGTGCLFVYSSIQTFPL